MRLREVLPRETLTMWSLTMPLGQDIKGGFLTAEVRKTPNSMSLVSLTGLQWRHI